MSVCTNELTFAVPAAAAYETMIEHDFTVPADDNLAVAAELTTCVVASESNTCVVAPEIATVEVVGT